MAVEARHLNLFPTQVLANRQFNHTDNNISADLYNNGNLIPSTGKSTGVNNTVNSFIPVYNNHMSTFNNNTTTNTTEGLLQQIAAKTSSYLHHHHTAPLRDDSGLTYNNNIVAPVCSRKRSRENSTVTVNHNSPYYSMPLSAGSVGNVGLPVKRNDVGLAMADNCTFLGEDMSVELMNHQSEFDRLISLHVEKLRSEVEERQRKQLSRVAYAIQQAVAKKLKDKEEELEKMTKLNCFLEQKTESLYLENQIWRDMAQNNEATANTLRDNLEQVLAAQASNNHLHGGALEATKGGVMVEDVGSCCGSSSGYGGDDGEDEVNTQQVLKWRKVAATPAIGGGGCDNGKVGTKVITEVERKTELFNNYCGVKNENNNDKGKSESTRMCRKCGKGESTVLLLPCRHLCLCANCGPTVNNCPICNFIKEGSVHVYLS